MGLTRPRAAQIFDLDYKQATRVITVTNVTLTGGAPAVVDGVSLVLGDRVLVTGQTTASQNGLYDVTVVGIGDDGTWERTSDGNATGEILAGMIVMVTEGSVYADTQWKLTTDNPIIIGTTGLTFVINILSSVGGANTQVQVNDGGTLAGFSNFVFDKTSNILSVTGNISATGNIAGNYFIGNGSQLTGIAGGSTPTAIVNGTSNVTVASNANTTVGVAGTTVATFDSTGLILPGIVNATGNITGNYFLGNGSQLSGIITTVDANTLIGNTLSSNIVNSSLTSTGILGSLSVTGNITGANVNAAQLYSAGALTITNGSGNINITPAGNVVLNNNYLTGLQLNPQGNSDAATKYYVDNMVSTALSYHAAVTAATTTTLATTTSGTITYTQPNGVGNGVGATLATTGSFNLIDTANVQTVGTRILVKDEGNAVFNGVYTWSNATVITRSSDADTYAPSSPNALSINDYFFVSSGNVNAGSAWIVDSPLGTITFGTSNIAFAQFSQSQPYLAGNGININGTVITAQVDNNTTAFDGSGNIIVKASANLTTPNIGAATGTSLSVTSNISGGNLNVTGNIVDTGALSIISGSNGNITLTPNGTGQVVSSSSVSVTGTIAASGAMLPRVVSVADGVSITMNGDTTDIATQTNTQAAGTLTINAVSGTLFNGQKIILRLQSANAQTFSWNAVFVGSTDLSLPTASSGSNKYDYVGFIYNTTASKWQLLAKNFGF